MSSASFSSNDNDDNDIFCNAVQNPLNVCLSMHSCLTCSILCLFFSFPLYVMHFFSLYDICVYVCFCVWVCSVYPLFLFEYLSIFHLFALCRWNFAGYISFCETLSLLNSLLWTCILSVAIVCRLDIGSSICSIYGLVVTCALLNIRQTSRMYMLRFGVVENGTRLWVIVMRANNWTKARDRKRQRKLTKRASCIWNKKFTHTHTYSISASTTSTSSSTAATTTTTTTKNHLFCFISAWHVL